MIGAIIHTTGVVDVLDKDWTLEQMQAVVGGYIERLSVGQTDIWLNEEGKLQGLEVNPMATGMAQMIEGFEDVIVGDVLLLGDDGGPESVSVKGQMLDVLLDFARMTGGEVDESAIAFRRAGK